MLDESIRTAVLELHKKGFGARRIARALKISRGAVQAIIGSGDATAPRIVRPEKAEPYREQIVDLYGICDGNLVRVHEELVKTGASFSYAALTDFCRRHDISRGHKVPSGRYHFGPGDEMQHDTSPHPCKIGGAKRLVQIASLVLCYSRMIFMQLFSAFTRFECKVFLTEAFRYLGGTCSTCMIDNTSVIRLKGSGSDMVPVPEMAAFAKRFGFAFVAHEIGDANRSARVEGHFKYVQKNFLSGRTFSDWDDANAQAREWCDAVNAKYSHKLKASRRELFAAERNAMTPLPDFVPDVYVLHQRTVDAEGYVNVRRNRYSAPYKLIGRQMEVRESSRCIDIFDGPRLVATHKRLLEPTEGRVTDPSHRPPRGHGRPKKGPAPEQVEIVTIEPRLETYTVNLAQHAHGRGVRAMQRLVRMLREYPRMPLLKAVDEACKFGMYDLDRLERMVLRRIAVDYFPVDDFNLSHETDGKEDDDEG